MSARRFVWRWSARLLRLEWRQHVVMLVLLGAGVALSVGGSIAAYNLTAPGASAFGNGRFAVTTSEPEALAASLRQQGHRFGLIARATVDRDGTTERVAMVQLDPSNDVTAPLLDLVEGRFPTGDDEIAITDQALAGTPAIGETVGLGGSELTVVGVVENPTSLSEEFVLTADLGAMSDATTQFFIDADRATVDFGAVPDFGVTTVDGLPPRATAVLLVNVIGALGMLEIMLLVGSAFAVLARRRSRQYGLLAAAGAPPRLIRSAAISTGVLLGLAGAVIGLVSGVGLALVVVPSFETMVDHRIDIAVPLWAVGPSAAIAVLAAAIAARLPAASLSRLSVRQLLASTLPQPAPAGRLALFGAMATGTGGAALVLGFTWLDTGLALLGTLLTPVGLLLLAPLLVGMVGRHASALPLPERLAGRAIARHNRRSAAVVAAMALALAVPMGIVVVTSSIDQRAAATGPNVAADQLIVWAADAGGPAPWIPDGIDEAALENSVATIATAAPDVTFVPIEVAAPRGVGVERDDSGVARRPTVAAIRRTAGECAFCSQDSYGLGERDEAGNEIVYDASISWIATPALLDALGLDDAWLDGSTVALVADDGFKVAWFDGILADGEQLLVSQDWPGNSSVPSVLVSVDQLDGETFERRTVGWLGIAPEPLDDDVEQAILDRAGPGVVLEFQDDTGATSALQLTGLAVGTVLAVGMTVSAVGLLTAESAGDTALLATLGAPARTGRRMSAGSAGLLGLCGTALGAVIGYVPLLPMVLSRADGFPFVVPWLALVVIGVAFPAVGGLVGWFVSGRPARGVALRESF